ncbi:MAG: hypothetical protein M1546_19450 [Chloroflexi bacterium]|nr:hypothetical protein [Chloroflexota bacterium]
MLGMYVHTHWGYNHPYAARTWTLHDWDEYLNGLQSLGYDFVALWPQLDCMPAQPNASDLAYLNTIRQAIDLAHDRYGMRFAVLACPNTIGNERAAAYRFEQRPYFVCERKIDPKDTAAVAYLLEGRRNQFEPLQRADALFVIDSDPGGYIDSTNDEFVDLMKQQLDILREFNPTIELDYWMWMGWENYNRFWAAAQRGEQNAESSVQWELGVFVETLALIRERIAEPWGVFACVPVHMQATDQLALGHKRLFFPYGLIEGEPTFPLTNFDPDTLAARVATYTPALYPRGIMANAQTHCVQLPHTYLFAHFARGGTLDHIDLDGFAEQVMPGSGSVIAQAWRCKDDGPFKRAAASAVRREIGKPHPRGLSSGLLLGDADRFLVDLAMGLEVRAALDDLHAALAASADVKPALRGVLATLRPYQQRLGFADAYYGPLRDGLNDPLVRLHDPRIDAVLHQFGDWGHPEVRNGILPRLLDALEAYCA